MPDDACELMKSLNRSIGDIDKILEADNSEVRMYDRVLSDIRDEMLEMYLTLNEKFGKKCAERKPQSPVIHNISHSVLPSNSNANATARAQIAQARRWGQDYSGGYGNR